MVVTVVITPIAISVFIVIVAALNLILDFDFVEAGVYADRQPAHALEFMAEAVRDGKLVIPIGLKSPLSRVVRRVAGNRDASANRRNLQDPAALLPTHQRNGSSRRVNQSVKASVNHSLEVARGHLLERRELPISGIIHQHVKPSESVHGPTALPPAPQPHPSHPTPSRVHSHCTSPPDRAVAPGDVPLQSNDVPQPARLRNIAAETAPAARY